MCLFKESLFNKPFLLAVKITFAFSIATLSKLFQRCCCCYLVNKVDLSIGIFETCISWMMLNLFFVVNDGGYV